MKTKQELIRTGFYIGAGFTLFNVVITLAGVILYSMLTDFSILEYIGVI